MIMKALKVISTNFCIQIILISYKTIKLIRIKTEYKYRYAFVCITDY